MDTSCIAVILGVVRYGAQLLQSAFNARLQAAVANNALLKPRALLLSQARRATIDDQRALLDWLLLKFKLGANPKP